MALTSDRKNKIIKDWVRRLGNGRTTLIQEPQALAIVEQIETTVTSVFGVAQTAAGSDVTVAGIDALKTNAGITADFVDWAADYSDLVELTTIAVVRG